MKGNYGPPEESNIAKYMGVLGVVIIAFILGWDVGSKKTQDEPVESNAASIIEDHGQSDESANMDIFWETWERLSEDYVDPEDLNSQKLVYGAVKGMVEAVGDPYTNFMDPEENQQFQESLQGHLQGIGAELTLREGILTVISPLKNSPAQKAGLQPEDIIAMVDDESTQDMTLEEAVMKIRGEKGTTVRLTILRESESEPIELEIVRADINVNSVEWEMKGDIALIEINQFGDNTKTEFTKAISEVLTKDPKGLILDLRFNGGGYLDGAVDISSEFLEKEKVVTIKNRNPEDDEVIYVNGKPRLANIPLVVLINNGSASASEIVAGAIQDNDRGTIIGEKSFGKGTVQAVETLSGGASLRVTIAKWFTPNDQNINEKGITPDIEIERSLEDFDNDIDPQMDAAIAFLNGEDVKSDVPSDDSEENESSENEEADD